MPVTFRSVCLVATMLAFGGLHGWVTASDADDGWKDRIRSAAYSNLSRIHSVDMTYESISGSGSVSNMKLMLSGTMARIDKDEVKAGSPPAGFEPTGELYSHRSSFNNVRSQFMEPGRKWVSLKDGNQGFFIPWVTPVNMQYTCVNIVDPPRWDKLLDEAAWEQTFKDARLAEPGNENVVVFTDKNLSNDAVVTFDPEAMYLPTRIEHIRKSDGVVLGRSVVKQWVKLGETGQQFCVATRIDSEMRSSSAEDFRPSFRLQVHEDELKINEPVEPAVFTLDIPEDYEVYDVDEVNRYAEKITQINTTTGSQFTPPAPPGKHGYGTIFAILASALLVAAAFVKWRQLESS